MFFACPITSIMNTSTVSDNYAKLGNLIIQWGIIEEAIQIGTVTLPIPFSNTDYAAIVTAYNDNYSSGGTRNYTTTSFEYILGNNRPCVWIAIGY